MKLIWHIDRARFEFSDTSEIEDWAKTKTVNFEFAPAQSDNGGDSVFKDPEGAAGYFEVTKDRGEVKFDIESDAVVVSAWVTIDVDVVDEFDEDVLEEWASEYGGWACSTIDLGDVDAYISEDDGGDWRIA
jgi:hypothetical protein